MRGLRKVELDRTSTALGSHAAARDRAYADETSHQERPGARLRHRSGLVIQEAVLHIDAERAAIGRDVDRLGGRRAGVAEEIQR